MKCTASLGLDPEYGSNIPSMYC